MQTVSNKAKSVSDAAARKGPFIGLCNFLSSVFMGTFFRHQLQPLISGPARKGLK